MADTYKLYVPFQLSDGKDIKSIPHAGEVSGFAAEIKSNPPYFAVVLSGIPSEKDAAAQFQKLVVGLSWIAIENRCGLLMKPELQKVYYPADPIQAAKNLFGETTDRRADGVFDGSEPAIWPEEKRTVTWTGQPVRLELSYNPARFLEVLNEGMNLPNPDAVLGTTKLKLAIDLYCLSHFRSSDFARFLVLCIVLETLAPEPSLSNHCVELVDKWMAEARAKANSQDGAESKELILLADRLKYLKTQSHRSRIGQLVESLLCKDGHSDSGKIAQEAKKLYDIRGGLTHEGKYQLGDGLSRLDEIVSWTLKAAMRHPDVKS